MMKQVAFPFHESMSSRIFLGHCSGTLISEVDIITSASCFDDSKLLHKKFKMLSCGSVNNMIALHPENVKKHEAFGTHNLAIIRIKSVTFSTVIRPACLTKFENVLQGSPVTVVGSGEQCKFKLPTVYFKFNKVIF